MTEMTKFNIKDVDQKQVEVERLKLRKQFTKIPRKKKNVVEKLIDNAAFMAVLLDAVQESIKIDGYVSEYQNGENQWGLKKSPAVEVYSQLISNYSKIIKQLTDLLPDEILPDKKDDAKNEITAFIQAKK